jgi:hypothetical protein
VGGGRRPPTGILDFVFTDGGIKETYEFLCSRPMNDGQWHHIAWVRQSTSSGSIRLLIYVDGALDNAKVYPDELYFLPRQGPLDDAKTEPQAFNLVNQSPLVLGQDVCQCCDGCRPYSGAAAELQLFSHALSAEEILTICLAQKAKH